MLSYPDIDPIAFRLGPLKVHWYGLMYLVAFGLGWWLGRLRARDPWRGWRGQDVDDVLFFVAVGVIVGGRLGYVLFYDGGRVLHDPMHLLAVWQGGMSFHGGLVGVLLAMALFARRRGRTFFEVADFVAPLVPLGLAAGRIGNFINGNLWGKVTDLPWGMVFPDPRAGDLPRHPSQLYQALLEGVALFVVLWWFSRRPRPAMAVSGLFLIGYAAARGAVEFVRVPDAQLGYLAFGWLTMGQLLTVPMLVAGVTLLLMSRHRPRPAVPAAAPQGAAPRPAPTGRGGRRRSRRRS
ncbi:MAG: prolipoprotein diacylglyceryl transferase [Ectothiorhodospiraceae bacterium]|nr:prolipoprotein diacylglyceryl transferase [Chromatiales bacterium]MCP5153661.1 prolipoprotein diacylglyceryl transferase [Ectothiorhodospiraceae bacterium]